MTDAVNSILAGPASHSGGDEERRSPHEQGLLDLLRHGRREEAKNRIESHKEEINEVDDGSTPLLIATTRGWGDVVEALVKKGANVNAVSDLGETPLMRAIKSGKIAPGVIKLILDSGGLETLNHAAKDNAFFAKWTALHFACDPEMNHSPAVIALLVLYGANIKAVAGNEKTPLGMCERNPENIKALQKPKDYLKSHTLPMSLGNDEDASRLNSSDAMQIGSDTPHDHDEKSRSSLLKGFTLFTSKAKKSSLIQQDGLPTAPQLQHQDSKSKAKAS